MIVKFIKQTKTINRDKCKKYKKKAIFIQRLFCFDFGLSFAQYLNSVSDFFTIALRK